jgi:hypothetical protein
MGTSKPLSRCPGISNAEQPIYRQNRDSRAQSLCDCAKISFLYRALRAPFVLLTYQCESLNFVASVIYMLQSFYFIFEFQDMPCAYYDACMKVAPLPRN